MIIYTKKLEINNEIRNFIAKLYNKKTIVSKLIKVKSLPFAQENIFGTQSQPSL